MVSPHTEAQKLYCSWSAITLLISGRVRSQACHRAWMKHKALHCGAGLGLKFLLPSFASPPGYHRPSWSHVSIIAASFADCTLLHNLIYVGRFCSHCPHTAGVNLYHCMNHSDSKLFVSPISLVKALGARATSLSPKDCQANPGASHRYTVAEVGPTLGLNSPRNHV